MNQELQDLKKELDKEVLVGMGSSISGMNKSVTIGPDNRVQTDLPELDHQSEQFALHNLVSYLTSGSPIADGAKQFLGESLEQRKQHNLGAVEISAENYTGLLTSLDYIKVAHENFFTGVEGLLDDAHAKSDQIEAKRVETQKKLNRSRLNSDNYRIRALWGEALVPKLEGKNAELVASRDMYKKFHEVGNDTIKELREEVKGLEQESYARGQEANQNYFELQKAADIIIDLEKQVSDLTLANELHIATPVGNESGVDVGLEIDYALLDFASQSASVEAASLTEKAVDLLYQFEDLQATNEGLKTQLDDVNQAYGKEQSKSEKLYDKACELAGEVTLLTQERDDYAAQLDHVKADKKYHAEKAKQFAVGAKGLVGQLNNANEMLRTTSGELNDIKASFGAKTKEYEVVSTQLSDANEELAQTTQDLSDVRGQFDELDEKYWDLKVDHSELVSSHKDLQAHYVKKSEDYISAVTELDKIGEKHWGLRVQHTELKTAHDALHAEKAELASMYTDLEDSNKVLSTQLEDLSDEYKSLTLELAEEKGETEHFKAYSERLEADNLEARSKISELESTINRLTNIVTNVTESAVAATEEAIELDTIYTEKISDLHAGYDAQISELQGAIFDLEFDMQDALANAEIEKERAVEEERESLMGILEASEQHYEAELSTLRQIIENGDAHYESELAKQAKEHKYALDDQAAEYDLMLADKDSEIATLQEQLAKSRKPSLYDRAINGIKDAAGAYGARKGEKVRLGMELDYESAKARAELAEGKVSELEKDLDDALDRIVGLENMGTGVSSHGDYNSASNSTSTVAQNYNPNDESVTTPTQNADGRPWYQRFIPRRENKAQEQESSTSSNQTQHRTHPVPRGDMSVGARYVGSFYLGNPNAGSFAEGKLPESYKNIKPNVPAHLQ